MISSIENVRCNERESTGSEESTHLYAVVLRMSTGDVLLQGPFTPLRDLVRYLSASDLEELLTLGSAIEELNVDNFFSLLEKLDQV